MEQGTPGCLPPGDVEEPPPPSEAKKEYVHIDPACESTVPLRDTFSIEEYDFMEEPPFMYRAIKKDAPERVFTAVPMVINCTEKGVQTQRRAYGVATFSDKKLLRSNISLQANDATVYLTERSKSQEWRSPWEPRPLTSCWTR